MPRDRRIPEPARDGLRRPVVMESVSPVVDDGRFPVKRLIGDDVHVEADVFTDGHDIVAARLGWRPVGAKRWNLVPMDALVNDRFTASFPLAALGRYEFTITAWVDAIATWRRGLDRKLAAGQAQGPDLAAGRLLVDAALGDLAKRVARRYGALVRAFDDVDAGRVVQLLEPHLAGDLYMAASNRHNQSELGRVLPVVADPPKAGFSAWYELFPRSASPDPARAGTLADVTRRLGDIAAMGFDIVYLPPIHPIGRVNRKGANNSTVCGPGEPGSPWAIGSGEGGHLAIHPEIGDADDVDLLVSTATRYGMDVALDIAFQCAPDHPYPTDHPEWFRRRPDGTIQYAENPPKKYEDIYPFDFDSPDWRAMWRELTGVVLFWADRGVRVFRVDNPHTKSFAFWEFLISTVRAAYPDTIFLSEAFTRPKVMYRLAKLGFTQSYTYFTWRNEAWELREYLTEVTRPPVSDFFRPNLWPNTPDILNQYLQHGGRAGFVIRTVLAGTLSANWGVYGPAFELCESTPRQPGSEEYLDSEKYQVRWWDHDRPGHVRDVVTHVNRLRRAHPALQRNDTLVFHTCDDPHLLCYSKASPDGADVVLVVVNVDPFAGHAGWVHLDLAAMGLGDDEEFVVADEFGGESYRWGGAHNFVVLSPAVRPAHVFAVQREARTERDFDGFDGSEGVRAAARQDHPSAGRA